jgi:hypothetical protein
MRPSLGRVEKLLAAMLLLTLGAALSGCGGSGSKGGPAASPTHSSTLSVTSSIKPGTVLSKPLVWHADVAPSGTALGRVDFVVDGKVRWTEQSEPYEFNEGRLFAPWPLGTGSHQLVVRAVTADGAKAETAAKVTVQSPPHSLPAGSYHRTVTEADHRRVAAYRDAAHGGSGDLPATGPWVLEVRTDGVLTLDVVPATQYDAFYEPYFTEGRRLTLSGPALWLQPHPEQASVFCEPERPGSYTWAFHGGMLTLAAVGQVCADRDGVLAGTWRKG